VKLRLNEKVAEERGRWIPHSSHPLRKRNRPQKWYCDFGKIKETMGTKRKDDQKRGRLLQTWDIRKKNHNDGGPAAPALAWKEGTELVLLLDEAPSRHKSMRK